MSTPTHTPSSASIPSAFQREVASLPPVFKALVEAELTAGNTIVEIGHTFPASPAGAYVLLANHVTTRPRESGDGLRFYDRNNSQCRGEFFDEARMFFVLEAPDSEEQRGAYPDMDAIRAAIDARNATPQFNRDGATEQETERLQSSAVSRFNRSRQMDYDKWKEGIGYDLDALAEMTDVERNTVASSLIPPNGWRDVEALVAIDSVRSRKALRHAALHGSDEVRLAVADRAPSLVSKKVRSASLVEALTSATMMHGLSEALDQAEEFHPAEVIEALTQGLLEREGDVAYHCAATLAVIHGKIESRYDWSLRPLFLRFNTDDRAERLAAFQELHLLFADAPSVVATEAARDAAPEVSPEAIATTPSTTPTPSGVSVSATPLIDAPASNDSITYETLAYLDVYDAILNADYAFVAYKETSRGSGEWAVRIKSSQTAGGHFDPTMIRTQARAAAAQGKPYFVWGFNMEPSAGDARQVEFRVHVANGVASHIEIVARMRNVDGSPAEAKSVTFAWPAV